MDATTAFVHQFCNQVSRMFDGHRKMVSFYLFHDKRPGTAVQRLQADAEEYARYKDLSK